MKLAEAGPLVARTLVVTLTMFQGAEAAESVALAELDGDRLGGERWWSRVQQGLAESECHASENGQGLQAPNRAHNLRTYFEPAGIRVCGRTPHLIGSATDDHGEGHEVGQVHIIVTVQVEHVEAILWR